MAALEGYLVRRLIRGHSARSCGQVFTRLIGRLVREPTDAADSVPIDCLAAPGDRAALWPNDAGLPESFLTEPLYQ